MKPEVERSIGTKIIFVKLEKVTEFLEGFALKFIDTS
jgi:hypothetical protein